MGAGLAWHMSDLFFLSLTIEKNKTGNSVDRFFIPCWRERMLTFKAIDAHCLGELLVVMQLKKTSNTSSHIFVEDIFAIIYQSLVENTCTDT